MTISNFCYYYSTPSLKVAPFHNCGGDVPYFLYAVRLAPSDIFLTAISIISRNAKNSLL